MVTVSHNANGWTGVKMGVEGPLTCGPDEMGRLKTIVLEGSASPAQVAAMSVKRAWERRRISK